VLALPNDASVRSTDPQILANSTTRAKPPNFIFIKSVCDN